MILIRRRKLRSMSTRMRAHVVVTALSACTALAACSSSDTGVEPDAAPPADAGDTSLVDAADAADDSASVDSTVAEADASSGDVSDAGELDTLAESGLDAADTSDTAALPDVVGTDTGVLDAGSDALDAAPDGVVDVGPDAADGGSDAGPASSALCVSCSASQKTCNGACRPVGTDPRTGCGSSCSPCRLAHATPSCAGGACAIGSCDAGWADCDGNAANGCEADLHSRDTCGGCSAKCATGSVCSAAGCVATCTPPDTLCTDRCANLVTDPAHCGSCTASGTTDVNAVLSCSGGTLSRSCRTGYTSCSGTCVDLANDPLNCGACNVHSPKPRGGTAACVAGAPVAECPTGLTVCSGVCVAPQVDAANCGACGKKCATGELCLASACVSSASIWLVSGLSQPEDVAIDASYVYWTDIGDGSVRRVAKGGGASTAIATGQSRPRRLALDDTYVYWSNELGGAIMRAPKDASAAPTIVSTAVSPWGVITLGSYVFFTDGNGVSRVPKAGGAPTSWASIKGTGLVTDGAGVAMWTTPDFTSPSNFDWRIDAATGATTQLGIATYLYRSPIAVDDRYLYSGYGSSTRSLVEVDKAVADVTYAAVPTLDSFLMAPTAVAPNACGTFWTGFRKIYTLDPFPSTAAPAIVMYRFGWPDWITLVDTLDTGKRIVTDAGYVYWTDKAAVGRLPLPR